MHNGTHVLGIVGSLRKASYNRMALKAAQQLAPQGMAIELFELHDIPLFNQDHEQNLPPAVRALKEKVRAADGVLFGTPEYNYGIPGVLKNAIDWASRPYGDNSWAGKPAAIVGASIGKMGTIRSQTALRTCFLFIEMFPVQSPEVLIGEARNKFDASGSLTDEATRKVLGQYLATFAGWIERLRQPALAGA
jgi:chromate reductase